MLTAHGPLPTVCESEHTFLQSTIVIPVQAKYLQLFVIT